MGNKAVITYIIYADITALLFPNASVTNEDLLNVRIFVITYIGNFTCDMRI